MNSSHTLDNPAQRKGSVARDCKRRILEAAARLFAIRGFKASTIREIAQAAQVNDVTVYRYFPRKRKLYWDAIQWHIQSIDFLEVIAESLAKNAPLEKQVLYLRERISCEFRNQPNLIRIIYFTLLELDAESRRLYKEFFCPATELIAETLRNPDSRIDESVAIVDAAAILYEVMGHCSLEVLLDLPHGKRNQEGVAEGTGSLQHL